MRGQQHGRRIRLAFEAINGVDLTASVEAMITAAVDLHRLELNLKRALQKARVLLDTSPQTDPCDIVLPHIRALLERHRRELAHTDFELASRICFEIVNAMVKQVLIERTLTIPDGLLIAELVAAVNGYLIRHDAQRRSTLGGAHGAL